MAGPEYVVGGTIWRHAGQDGWYFLTVPDDVTDEIRARSSGAHRPFGSLPVRAEIGETAWRTSIFFDRARTAYLLPVKADVRRRERLEEGSRVLARVALEGGP